MSPERQMAIREVLKRVGAEQPCERCKYATFEVAGEGRRFLIPGENVGGGLHPYHRDGLPTLWLARRTCNKDFGVTLIFAGHSLGKWSVQWVR